MVAAAEVIDLTSLRSSPPTCLHSGDRTLDVNRTTGQLQGSVTDVDVPLEDGELRPTVAPTNTNPRKQRKRKKSQHDSATARGEDEENSDKRQRRVHERDKPSRADSRSPPDRATRRPAKPSDSLFFVDDKPANIRDPYVPALAGPSRTQRNNGLVLPHHVKLTEGSSEVQEPPPAVLSDAEGGEEDFIDYLDIDGDRIVCISLAGPLLQYTLIQKMKDRSYSLLP